MTGESPPGLRWGGLGVRPRPGRRCVAPRLRRGSAGRKAPVGHGFPGPRPALVQTPRHPGRARDDRQRRGLRLAPVQEGLQDPPAAPPAHPALPSSRDDQPLQPASPRADAKARGPEPDALSGKRPAVRPGTKQALLVDLLRRREGGTIAEIQQATGWQAHTARAAITGLKKKSFRVTSAPRRDGVRAYRLTPKHTDHGGDVG
jgi:hypothetical protein